MIIIWIFFSIDFSSSDISAKNDGLFPDLNVRDSQQVDSPGQDKASSEQGSDISADQ